MTAGARKANLERFLRHITSVNRKAHRYSLAGNPMLDAKQLKVTTLEESRKMEPLLTSEQAAEILGIHRKVVERMAKRGEVPALKVGRYWRYREEDIESWVISRVQLAGQPCRLQPAF